MTKNRSYTRTPRATDFKGLPGNPKAAVFGLGVIPYSDDEHCWMLPDGPDQKDRRIWTFDKAMEFAKEMNALLAQGARVAITNLKPEA